jgi:hypothetical protein
MGGETMAKAAQLRAKTGPSRAKTASRAKRAARTKTAPFRVKSALVRAISAQTIMSLLRNVIDPQHRRTIKWDAPASDYIRGPVPRFYRPLNESPQFSGYGLALQRSDLMDAKTVADIGGAIIKWFRENGWQVIV